MNNILRTALLFCLAGKYLIKVSSFSIKERLNYPLIEDYLNANGLKVCVLISCNTSQDYHQYLNKLRENDIWHSIWDISNGTDGYETMLVRLSHQIGVVIDINCPKIGGFFSEISKRIFFHHERYWLMFSPNLIQAHNVLENQNVNVDAEISVAIPVGDDDKENYELYEAYNPSFGRGGKLNITVVGTWSSDGGYNYSQKQTKFERRRDFHGITFMSVVTIPTIPENETFLSHLESNDMPYLNSMSRFNYQLFKSMQLAYNFKMIMRRVHNMGDEQNGRWNGAIGMINRQEVDICVSGLEWENERYGAYEATTNSYIHNVRFIFRHPKSIDEVNIFTMPFTKSVWLSIIIVGIICSYTLRHIFEMENHRKVQKCSSDQVANEDSWSNSLLLVFGILFQQGYAGDPMLISSRILTLTVLIFSLLTFQFYSSYIVGSLLTEKPKTIKTIKQLLSSNLEFGIDEMPYVRDNLEHTAEESAMKLYERIIKTSDKSVMKLDEGLNLIKRGGFAFNTDGSYSYLILKRILTDDEICDLQEVTYTRESPTGPGVPKKSSLSEIIKISIRRMTETGILAYHTKNWLGKMPECQKTVVEVVPVDLIQFSWALNTLACGMALSKIILFIEIIVHLYQDTNAKISVDLVKS